LTGTRPPLLDPIQRQVWVDWLHGFANWTVMVTVTFRRCNSKGLPFTRAAFIGATRHFLRLVNCSCFGRRRVAKGYTVAFIPVIDDVGLWGSHPHGHFLLAAPAGMDPSVFAGKLARIIPRVALFDKQCKVERYYSAGGCAYLVRHGDDRMVAQLMTKAHSY
jgi:hypothetical protein